MGGLGQEEKSSNGHPNWQGRFYIVIRQFGYIQRVAIGPYLYLAIVRNAF
jgi:hypothetical protein